MSANTKIYYNSFIKLVAQRCILFASYIIWTILFANFYGPVLNKNFNLQISTYGLLLILCGLSLETGFTYITQKFNVKHQITINAAFVTALLAGIMASITALLFKNVLAVYFNVALQPWHAFAYVFAWLFTGTCQYIFQIKNRLLVFNVIVALITLILVACLYWLPNMQTLSYYGTFHFLFLIIQGIALYLAFMVISKEQFSFEILNRTYFKKVISYSLTVFAANLVTYFMFRIDYFILELYLNNNITSLVPSYKQDQLNGNYNIASRLVQTILTVTVIAAQTLFPIFAKENDKMLSYNRTNEVAKYVFIGFFGSCVIIAFSSKYVFPALFGKGFNTMYKDFFYLIPGLIAQGVSGCYSAFLMGINKVKVVLHGCLIALVVIIIGDILFIPKYGTLAAALVSSFGYTIQCFYSIFIIDKQKLYQ